MQPDVGRTLSVSRAGHDARPPVVRMPTWPQRCSTLLAGIDLQRFSHHSPPGRCMPFVAARTESPFAPSVRGRTHRGGHNSPRSPTSPSSSTYASPPTLPPGAPTAAISASVSWQTHHRSSSPHAPRLGCYAAHLRGLARRGIGVDSRSAGLWTPCPPRFKTRV